MLIAPYCHFFGEGNGTPLQYFCLENPMDKGAWCAAVHRVSKSQAWLNNQHTVNTNSCYYFVSFKITFIQYFFSQPNCNWIFLTCPSTCIGEGDGTPLQYSCLENPMDGGAWRATVHGVAKSQTRLSDFPFTFYFHALEKEMATHSSVLAWRIPGTREPGGLPSVGSHRVGHDWSDLAAAAAAPVL